MQAKELIATLREHGTVTFDGAVDRAILGIAYHSGRVQPGWLFAAVPGARADGMRFIPQALERGAAVVLYPAARRDQLPAGHPDCLFIGVEEIRGALALTADLFYGHPSRAMTLIGVTGTNGKTTTTYLIASLCRAAGLHCGVIGTISYRLGDREVPAEHTTPEAPDLQEVLRWMADDGARAVAMEVSSHALSQKRVDAANFAYAIFSNLSWEHLDYHGDMEQYYLAKRRLFTDFPLQAAIINVDDAWGLRLAGEVPGQVITYGAREGSDIRLTASAVGAEGISMTVAVPGGSLELTSPLLGEHNVSNILAAVALGWRMGLPGAALVAGIAAAEEVPGRFERVSRSGQPLVVVDYAHTPDALEKLLTAARKITTGRLILVFGCGGDRDRRKRPQMGEIAARLADLVIMTSDNPRSEQPEAIMEEIMAGYLGVRGDGCRLVLGRREAIRLAVEEARPADSVIIAGKGHEDYQILGQRKIHFDDRETAREALEGAP